MKARVEMLPAYRVDEAMGLWVYDAENAVGNAGEVLK